jgi:hypothetical protein
VTKEHEKHTQLPTYKEKFGRYPITTSLNELVSLVRGAWQGSQSATEINLNRLADDLQVIAQELERRKILLEGL